MSIASEIQRIQQAKAGLKTSIEAKGVTVPSTTKIDGYPALVDQISSGGGTTVEENNVNFYDYDGELVYSYTKAEFLALTAMPPNPSHTGFTAQGWNWSLADAQDYVSNYDYLNIGQHYVTSDGKTRVYVHIDDEDYLFFQASWNQSAANGVTIDWGDGSTPESVAGTGVKQLFHIYESTGDYVVEYTVNNGTVRFGGGSEYTRIFSPALSNGNFLYKMDCILRIELGSCAGFCSYCFGNFTKLEKLNIPSTAGTWDNPCRTVFNCCYKLKCVVVPNGVTYPGIDTFGSCFEIKAICIPKTITGTGSSAFRFLYNINTLTFPPGVTIRGTYGFSDNTRLVRLIMPNAKIYAASDTYSFATNLSAEVLPILTISGASTVTTIPAYTYSACRSLKSFDIPSTVTSIGRGAFSGCSKIKEIIIPQNVTVIDNESFTSMYSLSKIDIPSGVTSIGGNAFSSDQNLRRVNILSTTPPTLGGTGAFRFCNESLMIVVPGSSIESYRTATNWTAFKANLVGYLDTEPTQVDYISSDGTAFINTLFPVAYIGKVRIEMRYTNTNRLVAAGDGIYNIFASYISIGPANVNAKDSYAVNWGKSGASTVIFGDNDGDWHIIEADIQNKTAKLDDNTPVSIPVANIVNAPHGFGVFNKVGFSSARRASDRRSVKIWDIEGNLVRDMIPVKIDGNAYMYDRVDKLVFANANSTGTLSYTDF